MLPGSSASIRSPTSQVRRPTSIAPVAAAIAAKSSGATKSASARPSPQSMEWPGAAMKPSSEMHLFTTTLPLISRPLPARRHDSDPCAGRDIGEEPLTGTSQQLFSQRSGVPDRLGDVSAEARLLVVDDEPNIVELLSASLRYAGFEVATARSGTEAVRVAEEFQPDLLVLDVMMPGMNGFDVVRRLRADSRRVPVLFLTARDSTEDKITGLTLGGDDYVTKPFSLEEVIARIRAILRRFAVEKEQAPSARKTFADIELDEDTHEAWKAGELVALSPTEFKLP